VRRPAVGLVVVIALAGLGGLHAAVAQGTGDRPRLADDPELVEAGRDLFVAGCSSCHGLEGEGTENGPRIADAGEAAADFQLRTGRMPAAEPDGQQPEKDPAYDDDEIQALVAYVGSLGDGPLIPDVDPSRGDLSRGGELWRSNCAACHNASGIGGALSYGDEAPSVRDTGPVQVGEAMRTGPGQMPVFARDSFSAQDLDDIARYVEHLSEPDRRGGLSLGGVGPVTEGFVAVLFALGGIVLALRWITARKATS
jgi:ubiquinol-cytochrome c reductase cytochrome c subunit